MNHVISDVVDELHTLDGMGSRFWVTARRALNTHHMKDFGQAQDERAEIVRVLKRTLVKYEELEFQLSAASATN